jgi:Sel1 repeat
MTSTVFIPAVTERVQDAILLEISLHNLSPNTVEMAKSKHLNEPILGPLVQFQLYRQGYHALEMLRYLKLSDAVFSCPENKELHCSVFNGPVHGGSAELGLAIALLLSTVTTPMTVIASGCLKKGKEGRVAVGAVGKLSEKMAFVLAEQHSGRWEVGKTVFFVPHAYQVDAGQDAEGHLLYNELPINQLQPQIDLLIEAGIKVIPVHYLTEVIDSFQVYHASSLLPSKQQLRVFSVILALLLGFAYWGFNTGQAVILAQPTTVMKEADTQDKIALLEKMHHELLELQGKFNQLSSLTELRNKAESGNVKAQFQLASKFFLGQAHNGIELVAKDPVQAAFWFNKAASLGHVRAQYFLAIMYQDGIGVPKNVPKAKQLLRRAGKYLAEARHKLNLIEESNGSHPPEYYWEHNYKHSEHHALLETKTAAKYIPLKPLVSDR